MIIIGDRILVHATIVKLSYYKIICYLAWRLWVALAAMVRAAVRGPAVGAAVVAGPAGGSAAEPE